MKLWKSSDGSKTGGLRAEEVEMSLGGFSGGKVCVFDIYLLGQWLNFKLFGIFWDYIFSRENKVVQTFISGSIG